MLSMRGCTRLMKAALPILLCSFGAPLLHAHSLYICKQSDTPNALNGQVFAFEVSGPSLAHTTEFWVPVGQCRYITQGPGDYTIEEEQSSNTVLTSISATAADEHGNYAQNAILSENLNNRTVQVKVIEGLNTTVWFTNNINQINGRFTGGGSIFTSSGVRVTHGFELHCNASQTPNNLEVNTQGNHFHLTSLTSAYCYQTSSGAEYIVGVGTGTYDGQSGYTIHFTFSDAGEPGRNTDYASIDVTGPSGTVILASGLLDSGNQQYHAH